jgi:hypothetical protein
MGLLEQDDNGERIITIDDGAIYELPEAEPEAENVSCVTNELRDKISMLTPDEIRAFDQIADGTLKNNHMKEANALLGRGPGVRHR